MSLDHSQDLIEQTDNEVASPRTERAADTLKKMDDQDNIYGSFWIAETEFALPVSVIREVVNEPEVVSEVPLSPTYMRGLFNLRGAIIPIVDLRSLLDFTEPGEGAARKVAIIENGDLCIGLLFDKTGGVLNESMASRVDFVPNGGGVKDVVIEGVLKFDNGERMVQVLDPYKVLNLDKVPRSGGNTDGRKPKNNIGKRLNCISFQLGHTSCAIDLRFVQEVREMPPLDKSLLAHGYILGTSNLRGQTIPIVDFRSFVGDEPPFRPNPDALKKRKLLVMKSEGGLIGLMVYSIDSIIPYFETDVLPFAKLALPRSDIVSGCLIHDDAQIVMLLDHEQLMAEKSLVDSARSCQEVHSTKKVQEHSKQDEVLTVRRTFILFSFDKRFALDTADVSEVLNRPASLLEPPYALDFVEGIINLRNELITLINPRRLYGLPDQYLEGQKVIIFRHEDQKYAFLVDSVDEIVMTTEDKVTPLRPMDHSDTTRNVSEDVSGCVHVSETEGENNTVMILDVKSLVARCVRDPDEQETFKEAAEKKSKKA